MRESRKINIAVNINNVDVNYFSELYKQKIIMKVVNVKFIISQNKLFFSKNS